MHIKEYISYPTSKAKPMSRTECHKAAAARFEAQSSERYLNLGNGITIHGSKSREFTRLYVNFITPLIK